MPFAHGRPRPASLPLAALLLALGVLSAAPAVRVAPCPDADLDGYADCAVPGCDAAGLTCGDCDDGDRDVHPGALETCNHRDDDCDGDVDEGFAPLTSRRALVDRYPAASDRYGLSVASIGDVNGDGVPEFVVGSPLDDLAASDAGSAVLYSGADRTVLCRATGAVRDTLGESVAATGDMNGDGVPDFVGSEPAHDAIAVFSGADCSQIARCVDSAAGVSNLGGHHGLAPFVDVTGDGIPEVLAGADSSGTVLHQAGRAVVFTVSASGACAILRTLDDPALDIYAYLGYAILGLPDVTGDGVADIAVGEPGYASYRGCVLVFSGSDGALVRRIVDPAGVANDHLGESLATIECLDGDGTPELLVGSPRKSGPGGSSAGRVLAFSPEDGVLLRDFADPGGGSSDWMGWSVAALADLDGDGVDDILAGAYYADTPGGANAGKAVLFSGASGAVIQDLTDPGGLAGDSLGYSVASAGDLSGDGIAEILAGAPYDDGAVGIDEGSVSIFARETDCDGDGLGPFGGDCDDANEALWSLPSEARNLALGADRRTLTWDAPLDTGGSSVVLAYDVLRATAPGGFQEAACVASDQPGLTAQDPESPGVGAAFHYLVRAQNGCGEGTLGEDSAEDPRPGRGCP